MIMSDLNSFWLRIFNIFKYSFHNWKSEVCFVIFYIFCIWDTNKLTNFVPLVSFCTQKTSENQRFVWCFKGYGKRPVVWNELNCRSSEPVSRRYSIENTLWKNLIKPIGKHSCRNRKIENLITGMGWRKFYLIS